MPALQALSWMKVGEDNPMFETDIAKAWQELRSKEPLIHCITNPISINDCANVLLAAGAKPIMAEHPEEAAEITAVSSSLAVNLGNITDIRMKSMKIAGLAAKTAGINVIIDIVGAGCSRLRLDYAREYIDTVKPAAVKGNLSELMALSGLSSSACGIDVGRRDAGMNCAEIVPWLKELAVRYETVILATGKTDYVTNGRETYMVLNGCPRMAQVTGTGCMLNVLTAALMSVLSEPLEAAVSAASVFGLCGELADMGQGIGSYHTELLNAVSELTYERIINGIRIERVVK